MTDVVVPEDGAECGLQKYDFPKGKTDDRLLYWSTYIIAAVLIIINVTRLFDYNFWGDEAYSILISRYTTEDIIIYARDVDSHPPIFNLMLSFITAIFGQNVFAYHLTPFLPYVGIIILALTFVRKNFGSLATIIFMLLATLLDSSFSFIPEVRMYELGAFLVLASYASLYYVLKDGSTKYYVLLVITSLIAAYTHYYCLMAVGFFYIGLFFYFVLRHDWKGFKGYFIAGLVTVIGYLPWMLRSTVQTVEKDTNKFWIQNELSVSDCFLYMFDSDVSFLLFILFILAIAFMLMNTSESRDRGDSEQRHESRCVMVWLGCGLLSVIGSIMFGVIISALTTPLIIERYIYPVSVIIWLLFSIGVSRISRNADRKFYFSLFVIAVLLFAGTANMYETMVEEHYEDESTREIIDLTYDYLSPGDTIVTNLDHMEKNLGGLYFPDLNIAYIDDETMVVPPMDHSHHYLLFLTRSMKVSDIMDQLAEQGYRAVFIKMGNFASMYNLMIYDLVEI